MHYIAPTILHVLL